MKNNWYDNEEDILGIRIKEGEYWKSIELPNGIVIDISKEGEVIGMEIYRASRIFSGDPEILRKVVGSRRRSRTVYVFSS
jgi:uncharacterized protein YuzE